MKFGVNRTGTLILCDLALAMAKCTNEVDIYNLTKCLREQRPHMVNKMENYLLVHLVVLEVLMEIENPFKKSLHENLDENVIKQQLNYLKRLQWNDSIVKSQSSQCATNPELHTSFVDGYETSENYLVTRHPTQQTVTEFWKIIVTEQVTHILFLKKLNENIPMWPHRIVGSATIISVRLLEKSRKSYGIINYLEVRRFTKTTGQIIYETNICLFELHDWSVKRQLKNSFNLLKIMLEFNRVGEHREPCLIACKDGVSASGLFVVLSYIFRKFQKELEIDVCNAIRTARRNGTEFVDSAKQLKVVHMLIRAYFHGHDKYYYIEE
ncbi:receptor-type tyrosine-protein phosphatase U-like isoform X8 [Tenebrio molitor]|uniref:receptor-type tyrosine-protein phosphatase U-like isoform X8 n=1 Tax=Tenebrio molitor TaxID=7067 RepID=UPI0036246B35